MDATLNQISGVIAAYVPNLIGALAILVVGWLVARVLTAIMRGALHRTGLDNRIAQWIRGDKAGGTFPIEF